MAGKPSTFGAPKPLPGQAGYSRNATGELEEQTAQMEARLDSLRQQMSREKERRESTGKVGGARWTSARTDRGSVRNYAKDVKDRHSKKDATAVIAKQGTAAAEFEETFAVESGRRGGLRASSANSGGEPIGSGGAPAPPITPSSPKAPRSATGAPLPPRPARDSSSGGGSTHTGAMDMAPPPPPSGFANKEVAKWGVRETLDWLTELELPQARGAELKERSRLIAHQMPRSAACFRFGPSCRSYDYTTP